jgi:hypothetical protein
MILKNLVSLKNAFRHFWAFAFLHAEINYHLKTKALTVKIEKGPVAKRSFFFFFSFSWEISEIPLLTSTLGQSAAF